MGALIVALLCALTVVVNANGLTVGGRTSWYGGPCDRHDNNRTATGIPNTVPGIALYRRDTFGAWFLLTRPKTGRRVVVRHVDYGPAPWTGKLIDLNPPAATGLGFTAPAGCVQSFPTGERMSVTLITRRYASRWARRTLTRVDDRWIWTKPRRR